MIPSGDPEKNKGAIPINPMIEGARHESLQGSGSYIPEQSALGHTLNFIENGIHPETLKSPELVEALDQIQEEMTRTLIEPLVLYTHDARTGFTTADWQMGSARLQTEGLEQTIKTKSSIKRPFRPEKETDLEKKKVAEEGEHLLNIYQSRVAEEVKRLASLGHIMSEGVGPMGVYFDGRRMMGVNERRLTTTPIDRYRLAFGKHRDKELNKYQGAVSKRKLHEEVQKKLVEGQPKTELPEDVRKILIEGAPKFFEEGFSDLVKEDAALMHDIVNVLSEMNKRNVFVGPENEMRIKPQHLSTTEQELLGALFQKVERIDEHGHTVDLGKDKTRKITVYLDKSGNQYSQDKDGNPLYANGRKIDLNKDKQVITREFYINLLTYENTVGSEVEHKRFISLLMAYTMLKDTKTGLGVREILQDIVKRNPNLKLGLSEEEVQRLPLWQQRDYRSLELLVAKVDETAKDLDDDWDSPRVRQEREAASAAFEVNFMIECATLQIANIGHMYKWEMVEETEKNGKGTGKFKYKFLDEIGDPNMALDAMTAMFTMQHEWTYAAIKNRVSTPLLPPADPAFAERIVNFVVAGGKDPEILNYARSDEYIARMYGIIGMFPELRNDKDCGKYWQEGEQIRLKQKRSDGTQRECSEEFLQSLEQTMFGVPTVYDGKVFPMPIAPYFSLTLFDSMHVSKDKTLQDKINERTLLTEIDYEQQHPFSSDGRMVSGRFVTDMTYIMYGGADVKGLHGFFASPFEAIRKIVKSMDIGPRSNVKLIDFIKNRGKKGLIGNSLEEASVKLPINKKFHEITYAAYMSMAYLAFVKFDMFSGGKKWESHREAFSVLHQPHHRDEKPEDVGFADFLEAFSYQLPTKQGVEHYGDAMYLLFMGLREVVEGISKTVDHYYEEKVQPVYAYTGAKAQDPAALGRNVGHRTGKK